MQKIVKKQGSSPTTPDCRDILGLDLIYYSFMKLLDQLSLDLPLNP